MEQLALPRLLGRLEGPSVCPSNIVSIPKTYREAVRTAWQLRRVKGMTQQLLAAVADLYPAHVSDYLNGDDKPSRRDLPADKIAAFETAIGNTLVSQWLANRSRLTILEELQATREAA